MTAAFARPAPCAGRPPRSEVFYSLVARNALRLIAFVVAISVSVTPLAGTSGARANAIRAAASGRARSGARAGGTRGRQRAALSSPTSASWAETTPAVSGDGHGSVVAPLRPSPDAPRRSGEVSERTPVGNGATSTTERSADERPAPLRPSLVSVVIPARNAASTIEGQLAALAAQTYDGDWEIIVVDDGSTDDTREVTSGWADRLPRLRVVDGADHPGMNRARNAGALAACGDLLLFCDADDVVAPGWLAAMAEASRTADLLGGQMDEQVLNATTIDTRPPHPREHLPVALDFLPFAVGANCGVRAIVYRQLGGFDETYERGGTEVEFFWRAQLAGHDLSFVHDAVVHYRYRDGLGSLARQYMRYGRADAQLYRSFRHHGLASDRFGDVGRAWLWIAADAVRLPWRPDVKARLTRRLAYRVGRARGSARFRVLFL